MGAAVTFRKRDLDTAIAVAQANGLTVTGTEILRDGTIRLIYGKAELVTVINQRPQGVDSLDELVDAENTSRTA